MCQSCDDCVCGLADCLEPVATVHSVLSVLIHLVIRQLLDLKKVSSGNLLKNAITETAHLYEILLCNNENC